ncbi:IncW-like replication protein [Candidatus Nitrosotalea sp. TS]|uniref:replication protein RepA n=1 Tax=Candidatus Nitrosotalea sp. TS TaxID=2341020 RepID=UPI00140B080E|nr:replication protein RepA [Candidatus Nitrosotalea sp. TS]NHI03665.1 IncW-like replication protein [Candidatus Nitrosotalea sp. TS]
MPLTPQQENFLDAAVAIRLDPDKAEAAFIARQLVQATLPHRNPKTDTWRRTNGNFVLGMQAGYDALTDKKYGLPYGTIPRLLLFWITTEALRTANRRLELGNSLASFMRQLDLDPSRGGKRSDAKRIREQMERLFNAKISFQQSHNQKGKKGYAWMNMDVAPKGMLWWDEKQPHQSTLWKSWIQLGEEFFAAITSSPVPVDMRALKALKSSPLALDLYSWATYTAYRTQQNGQARSISWKILHNQLGTENHDIKDFSKKAKAAFKKIQQVYPDLGLQYIRGGVSVLPCNPAITIKLKPQQLTHHLDTLK